MTQIPGQLKIPAVPYMTGSIAIIKDLFTSIITRLEMLAVHIETAIAEQAMCKHCSREKPENDCNT